MKILDLKINLLYGKKIWLLSFLIASTFIFKSYAQSESELLKRANDNYNRKDYFEASKLYKLAGYKIQKHQENLLKAGISSYEANDLDFAIQCFEKLVAIDGINNTTVNWYLAKSHQFKNQFAEAIIYYKRYLKNTKNDDPQKSFVKNELLRCEEGIKYLRRLPLAIVESIGSTINTSEDEFAGIPISKKNGSFYISAIRKENQGGMRNAEGLVDIKDGRIRSDIYLMTQTNGTWSLSRILDLQLNSNMDDMVLGFLEGGDVQMVYRGWHEEKGNLFLESTDNQKVKLNHSSFLSPMVADIGDHAVSIFQDSIMIFSSCRTGGYGGYDLYFSVKRNERWSRAFNLGATVNTSFNEDFPFLANDGRTLYFSSDNLKSMGGFDIYKSKYMPEAQYWSKPSNLGIPINSAGNDIYFRLTNDGLAGIFSSDRKTDNYGGKDIYLAYFQEHLTEQLTKSMGSPLSNILNPEYSNQKINEIKNDVSLSENFRKEELKTYLIDPVYYWEEDFISDSKTKKNLDRLVLMLQIHPGLTIQLIGHSYEETQDPINLYFSIKKAEALEKYLIEKNILDSRINCFGVGASLPFAKQIINGNKSVASEKLNKRIEINLLKIDSTALKVIYPSIPAQDFLKSEHPSSFRILRSALSYSLFLGESNSILNHPLIRFSEGLVFVEKNVVDEKYRYFFGLYNSFKEAEKDFIKYQSLYKIPLEIKAFHSGRELSRPEIIDHVLKDADLLHFLNYLNNDKNKK